MRHEINSWYNDRDGRENVTLQYQQLTWAPGLVWPTADDCATSSETPVRQCQTGI